VVPFVTTDRAQKNRIGLLTGIESRFRQRLAVPVDSDSAKVVFPKLQAEIALVGD